MSKRRMPVEVGFDTRRRTAGNVKSTPLEVCFDRFCRPDPEVFCNSRRDYPRRDGGIRSKHGSSAGIWWNCCRSMVKMAIWGAPYDDGSSSVPILMIAG